MRRLVVGIAAPVALVVALGACSSSARKATTATTATSATGPTTTVTHPVPQRFAPGNAAYWTLPDPIPSGTHGDLIRYQSVADPPEGTHWYRIMYLSTTAAGKPTVETGMLTVPDGTAPPGGWKLAAHAHGSTGLARDCAPSFTLSTNRSSAAELILVATIAAKDGYVVASADYEGQGTFGHHPFLVGTSEGRSVLDAARAARRFPGLTVSKRLAIVGYSQGGHAALWANQLASTWTPEFHVVGTLAGAPASEVAALMASSAPSILDNQQAVGVLAGLASADPKLEGDLDKILTPAGKQLLDVMERSCTPPADFKVGSPLLTTDPLTTQPWKDRFAANTPGSVATADPVLIIHSDQDQNVPIGQSETLLRRMCAAGQVVERRVLPTGSHVAAAVPAYQQGFAWLQGLASGDKAVSSCTG